MPALRKLRLENHKFEDSLGYRMRPCQKEGREGGRKRERNSTKLDMVAGTCNPN
jgi:hypothetical protein